MLACLALLVARGEAGLDDLIQALRMHVKEDEVVVRRVKPYWDLLRAYDKRLATLEEVCGDRHVKVLTRNSSGV